MKKVEDAFYQSKEVLRLDFEGDYAAVMDEAYAAIEKFRSDYEAIVDDFRTRVDESEDLVHSNFMAQIVQFVNAVDSHLTESD